jgi:hypothetical protein
MPGAGLRHDARRPDPYELDEDTSTVYVINVAVTA